jgi:hypothetical protein
MKWAAGLLLLPVAGLWVLRFSRFSRITLAANIVLATGIGTVETAGLLLVLAFLGVRWNPAVVFIPALVGGALGSLSFLADLKGRVRCLRMPLPALFWLVVSGAALAALGFALLTARGTSVDYLFFWGTKGFRFASVRTIDTVFLSRPDHLLMHPDYPPLVPLVYAFCSLVGGTSWWIGLAATWFFVLCSALALWGFLSAAFSIPVAAEMSALGCLILTLGILVPFSGGNAEAVLIFFVTVSLGVLTCLPRGQFDWLVTLMLAGATLAKLEGGVFSALVVLVYGIRGGAGRGGAALCFDSGVARRLR